MEDKVIIAVAGLPGAGKSVVARAAKHLKIPVYRMGDVIRREAETSGLSLTDESLGEIALSLRKKFGEDIVARKIAGKITRDPNRVVLVDGVRSMSEVDFLRKRFNNVIILSVHASPKTRYERLRRRGRQDDPKSWEEFAERDERELRLGLGNVIALSDVMLVNEETTEKDFYIKSLKCMERFVRREGRSKAGGKAHRG